MGLTWVDVRGRRANLTEVLPRPGVPGRDVREAVAGIVDRVRTGGDEALRTLTAELDGVVIDGLRVDGDEVQAALERIPGDLRQALEAAKRNIAAYHAHEPDPPSEWHPEGPARGLTVRHLVRPVERAGCYAPGGRARYPSTVLMCAVPAKVAGVEQVALCVPPGADGRVDDATLAAAALAEVDEVYRVGGAQAIAAMAYGTKSIRPVDVVVGPGNQFVAEAKRQVAGAVGVASAFAGPSEVVVVAAPETPARFAAVDVVVQAEHGPDGTAWLVTWDEAKAHEVEEEIVRLVAASARRADLEPTLAKGGYVC
ncbi:MAG: histidinol dehydrogenase, partial [Mycobacteriales bacterium]